MREEKENDVYRIEAISAARFKEALALCSISSRNCITTAIFAVTCRSCDDTDFLSVICVAVLSFIPPFSLFCRSLLTYVKDKVTLLL